MRLPSSALALLMTFALAFALAPGCSTHAGGPPAQDNAPIAPAAPASAAQQVDLATVMRRAHFAFRRDGDAWKAKHATYTVRADASLHLVPRLPDTLDDAPEAAAFDATVTGIERGGVALGGPAGDRRATPEGAIDADRGAAVERLESGDDGIEQSFRFPQRPGGSGDLVVRVAVSGEDYTGQSASGLHFADPGTGLGVWYGRAVWTDARGRTTPLELAYRDGSIAVTVPAAVVDDAAYPAVLDPTVGPEFGMDNPVRVGATDTQNTPVASFSVTANATLVVWADYRNDTTGATEYADVYGARVTPAGVVLDLRHRHQHGREQPARARGRVRRQRVGCRLARRPRHGGHEQRLHGASLDGGRGPRFRRQPHRHERPGPTPRPSRAAARGRASSHSRRWSARRSRRTPTS